MARNNRGGRRRTPSALDDLRGNPSKRKRNGKEPASREGGEECPAEFTGPTRDQWHWLLTQFQLIGVWSEEYRAALIEYCEAFEIKETALAAYRADPQPTVLAGNGAHKPNPILGIISQQKNALKAWLIEFGLTPCSRTKLVAQEKQGEDGPLLSLLKQ